MNSPSGLSQRWEPRAWRLAAWPMASRVLGSAGRAASPTAASRAALTAPRRAEEIWRGLQTWWLLLYEAPLFFSFFFFPLHSASGVHTGLSGNYLKSQAINELVTGLFKKSYFATPKCQLCSSHILNSSHLLPPLHRIKDSFQQASSLIFLFFTPFNSSRFI